MVQQGFEFNEGYQEGGSKGLSAETLCPMLAAINSKRLTTSGSDYLAQHRESPLARAPQTP